MTRNRRRDPRGTSSPARRPSPAASPGRALGRALITLERRGRVAVAAVLAVALVWLAAQRVPLGGRPTYLGKHYAMLAADPLHPAADNPVGHRILAPLLSYVVGLRGPYIIYTLLVVVLVLLAAAYLWFRGRDHPPGRALLGASTLALSMVAHTTLHYGGYPDALLYLLVFAAWWSRSRLWASCLLFLLAALTHESALFLTPWLLIELARSGEVKKRGWNRATAGMAAALIGFVAVRGLLERAHPDVAYSLAFYARPLLADPLHWFRESAQHRWLGIAAAFNLYWAFPLVAAAHLTLRGARHEAGLMLMPIPLALAQLLIAYDVTRLATLAFMSVLLGAEHLLRTDAFSARRWAPLLAAANFFIPQLNVAMGAIDVMSSK